MSPQSSPDGSHNLAAGRDGAVAPVNNRHLPRDERPEGACGFDFLLGSWRVAHRKLSERLVGSTTWIEFPGTLQVDPLLSGLGNIDRNVLDDPAGSYLATSLRVYFPALQRWSVYWIDGRTSGMDKPVIGQFDGPVGRFYNDDEFGGRPIQVRFTYRDVSFNLASWEQAFSSDGGQSWEPNWTMTFHRLETR